MTLGPRNCVARTTQLAGTAFLFLTAVLAPADVQQMPVTEGQIVRVELPPGRDRPLRLAEVEVYVNGKNAALGKTASQSSIFSDIPKYQPGVAVDLGRAANTGSYTTNEPNPWWEVDLGSMQPIEKIILYKSSKRLGDLTLTILDSQRNKVFSQSKVPEAERISFFSKDLGDIWFIGDQATLGSEGISPRSVFHEHLSAAGYAFRFTGHTATNPQGLPDDPAHHHHSAVASVKIAQMTKELPKLWSRGLLATNKPETLCILIGSNDIGAREIDGTAERVAALLDGVYALPGIGAPASSSPPFLPIDASRPSAPIPSSSTKWCKRSSPPTAMPGSGLPS